MALIFPSLEDDKEDLNIFVSNETEETGIFSLSKKERRIIAVPTATTANIMKIRQIAQIDAAQIYYPDEGTLQLPYAINPILNSDVSEWSNQLGILIEDLSTGTLKQADGQDFPANIFAKVTQTNQAHGISMVDVIGGGSTTETLDTDATQTVDTSDITGPITDEVLWKVDLGSTKTIKSLWVQTDIVSITPNASISFKFQTSTNDVDWTDIFSQSTNVEEEYTDNEKDVSIRYIRMIMTIGGSEEVQITSNLFAWN